MERFDGRVDFKNVTFAYPSRPNVPVRLNSYYALVRFQVVIIHKINVIAMVPII